MKTTDKDPWKELVEKNRTDFDTKEPKDLWEAIENELDAPSQKEVKMVPLWKVYRIAAALVLVLTAGYFLVNQERSEQPTGTQTAEAPEVIYSDEFIEAENYYASEINQKTNELLELVDDETLIEEVNLLRDEFDELKKEMGDNINDQRIVEAMIQNYRLRLNLLKEMLSEMKKGTTEIKNKKDDTKTI